MLASFLHYCVMIFTKYGTTHNHTGSATATVTAGKIVENRYYSTFKSQANMEVKSLPNDMGVYEMKVHVTGKNAKTTRHRGLGGGTVVLYQSGAEPFTDDIDDSKKYRKWGRDRKIKIWAYSNGEIISDITNASDDNDVTYEHP